MRVAFFSPLPPSRSGIADYSETLLKHLERLVEVEAFPDDSRPLDPSRFDVALYHMGNNPYHVFTYEAAMRHPGVVVMHESNLHHLMTDLTIRRGDWEGYLAECEYNGGPEALAYARRVRALEVGPDYDGLPMTRRLLERSRALIVHSRFMVEEMRVQGFHGPVARVPHGAWIPQTDRQAYRERLGLDELTPLVGIFGFLKPYKRIAESLRAFRRLLRMVPQAKMILVGEPHPDLEVEQLIHSLGLWANVRVLGFTPIEDFEGYIAACDIVLNLRYPTVGESSGSLLRALGLGKAVLVSDVGAFRELPEDVCLKVPVDAGEENLLFEYLNLLVSRPTIARELGVRARRYVEQECRWDAVAGRYADFLRCIAEGREWQESESPVQPQAPVPAAGPPAPPTEFLKSWAATPEARTYIETHLTRLQKTLEITPPGGPEDRVLEMGAYLQITPALKTRLGYGEVRGCYYGPLGQTDHRAVVSAEGEKFECAVDLFNAEKDQFPYADQYFSTVLCCELIEHLFEDPMHLMAEVNRILRRGGHLVLTTPNIVALRGLSAILQGYHPGFFHAYLRPSAEGQVDARHNREYTPREIHQLLENAGFEVALLETGPFRDEPRPEYAWVMHLLERYSLSTALRGDGIYAVGRKTGGVRERYPAWLYS
ncbi:MAG TPA: glycosyltransferase [Bryobacteraceae bacterium]|nr:glycosyltransferase [Bryobacteraceae bacterium]